MRDYGPTLIVRVRFLQSRAALLRHWLCHECQLMRELVSCDKLHNMAFRCSLAKTLKAGKMRIEPLSHKSAVSQDRLVNRAYLEGGLCETEMIMVANLVSVFGRQNKNFTDVGHDAERELWHSLEMLRYHLPGP